MKCVILSWNNQDGQNMLWVSRAIQNLKLWNARCSDSFATMMLMVKMEMMVMIKVIMVMLLLNMMMMTLTSNDDAANFAFSSWRLLVIATSCSPCLSISCCRGTGPSQLQLGTGEAAQSRTHFTYLSFFQSIYSLSGFKSGTHFTFYFSSRASTVFFAKKTFDTFLLRLGEATKDDTQFTFASVLQVSIPFQLVHSCMRASLSRLLLTHGKTSLCADGQGFQIEETAPFSSVRPPKLSDGHLSSHHGQVRDYLQSNSKKPHSW